MKIIFDENLPRSLPQRLAAEFPDSVAAADVHLASTPDDRIRAFARHNGYVIATKDSRFYRDCVALGAPPKIIWVALGNCSVPDLVAAFRQARERLESFAASDDAYMVIK